jgi:hypothetical protein
MLVPSELRAFSPILTPGKDTSMIRLATALAVVAVALTSPLAAFAASWSNGHVHPQRASWSDHRNG